MVIFDEVCEINLLKTYLHKIQKHFSQQLENGEKIYEWQTRNITLSQDDSIINFIKNFIENKLKVELDCDEAELQTWPINSFSNLHQHNYNGRENGDYNSLLYLNDDFVGGEFYTEDVIIKPKVNRLTFFDGYNIKHGVKKVENNHRHTVIFWWKNTKFY